MAKPDYAAVHRQAQAAIIANDLDSLVHRIEGLEANPRYTNALTAVQKAKEEMLAGRAEIHQENMRRRFAEADQRRGHAR